MRIIPFGNLVWQAIPTLSCAKRARGYRYVRDISSGPNPDGHKNAGYGRIRSDSQNPHLIQDHSDHSAHGIRFRKGKEIAKQCEFTDYVVKPIDIKELKKLIVKVLA